jgi:hypothetical protein
MKITGFMTIKNEWPLAAVSISHALINHVDQMYIVDNGSQDGTWQGLKILQEIFPNRIHVFYYESEEFNQKAIAHSIAHLATREVGQPHWGIFLDADEFLIFNNKVNLHEFLRVTNLDWHSLIVDVLNYIPPLGFREDELDMYPLIEYKVKQYFEYIQRDEFLQKAEAGKVYWEQWKTQSKVIINLNIHKLLGHAAHQVEYGDGSWMIRHDEGTAVGADEWGLFIAHLPYTSEKRIHNRISLKHTEQAGNSTRFFMNKDFDSTSRYILNAVVDKDSKLFADSITLDHLVMDLLLSESVKSVFPLLKPRWKEIISAPYVVADTDVYNFASLVEMSADYILVADKLWRGGRK